MSRKRVQATRANPTLRRYLADPVYRSIDRLGVTITPGTLKVSQSSLASFLRTRFRPQTIFFPDTNFITGPIMHSAVWKEFYDRRIGITELVLNELRGWLNVPVRHSHFWRELISLRPTRDARIWIDSSERWPADHRRGISYYVNLLAERKRVARRLTEEFEMRHARPPSDEERYRLFQTGRAQRDFHVYCSGEKELRTGGNVFTDEHLMVTACAVGLCSGHDTVVLTRDRGAFDQFAKLTDMLIWHYQAMRFAESLAAYPTSFEMAPMPTGDAIIDAYFVAEKSFLVRKPVADLDHFVGWLLPPDFVPVKLYCLWLGGEAEPFSLDVCCLEAERDMDRIIAMKGRSRGWSTDRLGRRNCHVTGFPKTIPNPREFVLVVQDREIYAPDGSMAFSQMDLAHAVTDFGIMSRGVPHLGQPQ